MQLQGVADIVEANAMAQLRRQQSHDMTPRPERARFLFHPSLASYLRDFMRWNKIANLAQNVELRPRWLVDFVFHPCRVAGFKSLSQRIFSQFLWDGCDFFPRL
jgi:hypothetical protein